MYQILQKFDIHWHDGGPSIAMMYHLRRVSYLLCNWKSCLLCYMKDVVLHCSIFFKWNKLVRVRVRVRVRVHYPKEYGYNLAYESTKNCTGATTQNHPLSFYPEVKLGKPNLSSEVKLARSILSPSSWFLSPPYLGLISSIILTQQHKILC